MLTAITTPAKYLADRGVSLSEARYRQILMDQITGIKQHGDTAKIKSFCGYFLHCIQKHMQIHGERYYNEGKVARNQVDKVLSRIQPGQAAPDQDNTTERLAELHAMLKSGMPRRKKKSAGKVSTFKQGTLL